MSLLDRLRNLSNQINKSRLESEADARRDLESRGYGRGHDPITGLQAIKDGRGGNVNATPITTGSVGGQVQLTGRIADALPSKAGGSSALDTVGRGAPGGLGGGSSFLPPQPRPGGVPVDQWWEPNEDGTCSLKAGRPGTRPATGAYSTPEDCVGDNQPPPNGVRCQNGVCVEAAEGEARGNYKTLAECEEALGPPALKGGQCDTFYGLRLTVLVLRACGQPYETRTLAFSAGWRGPITPIGVSNPRPNSCPPEIITTFDLWNFGYRLLDQPAQASLNLLFFGGVTEVVGVEAFRLDGLPDTCGDSPRDCP